MWFLRTCELFHARLPEVQIHSEHVLQSVMKLLDREDFASFHSQLAFLQLDYELRIPFACGGFLSGVAIDGRVFDAFTVSELVPKVLVGSFPVAALEPPLPPNSTSSIGKLD